MKPDEVPQEWAEAGGRALYEDTWLPELWPAWEALHEKRREEYRHRFAVTLAAVIPQVKAAALREWAEQVRAAYPEDIFIPLTPARLVEVHLYLAGRGGTLDALSAHLMRDAARLADDDADRIERGES